MTPKDRQAGAGRPRARLLDAAEQLTYDAGVHVGIDEIIRQAGVARASLYQNFGSKDGLIASVLHEAADRDLAAVRAAIVSSSERPGRRILGVFDALAARVADESFHGCRYAAAELGLVADTAHPAHRETARYVASMQRIFADELQTAGCDDAESAAVGLVVLVEGVLATAVLAPAAANASAARRLAEHLIASSIAPRVPR